MTKITIYEDYDRARLEALPRAVDMVRNARDYHSYGPIWKKLERVMLAITAQHTVEFDAYFAAPAPEGWTHVDGGALPNWEYVDRFAIK